MSFTGDQQPSALAQPTMLPMAVYALYLIGIFTGGLASIVGVIIAYVQRGKADGAYLVSHYRYQIRTFWIGLLYSCVAAVLSVVGIGFVLAIGVVIWLAVRCILGINRLAKREPIAVPTTWLW
jgi:uncharacterized membrane protein